ncbi:hypothetical protein SAMN04489867_3636 [Pedococcus dokdonensis]|uniref:Uncharacterized protein n=1 Tax=Pedococcus dokdonensis TaxID=443156 RepID=A0A1H0V305_9MICO|nr:hypothetical protein SAMN04489867_3636 [Pedococcus dokdonensis]
MDVPTQGVSVAAPQGWVKFTSKDTPESLAAAAKALGMTVEELKATLASQYLLQLRAPAPDPSNLNASVVDLDQVPSEGALVSQLEAAGAQDVTVRPLRTAVGDALLARYRQQVGSVTVHGAGLFVDTGDELLNLTVSSPDESTVTARADVLATSIHRT